MPVVDPVAAFYTLARVRAVAYPDDQDPFNQAMLCDWQIAEAHSNAEFFCYPWNEQHIQPASIDLALSPEFLALTPHQVTYIDPRDQASIARCYTLYQSKEFILHPGQFVLGSTVEHISLGHDAQGNYRLVGRVEGRSSWGRLGILIHSTAGYIDPGFHGHITLEIANIGPTPVLLPSGSRICQLSLLRCGPVMTPYRGKYNDQQGPTASHISDDKEFQP